jgi:tetratricopeptide (TPR) repeat protein
MVVKYRFSLRRDRTPLHPQADPVPEPGKVPGGYKFEAFISYTNELPDRKIARKIHVTLETFRSPPDLRPDLGGNGYPQSRPATALGEDLSGPIPGPIVDGGPDLPQADPADAKARASLGSVFLDHAELSSTPRLSEELRTNLNDSRFLIVICSPRAKDSDWVRDEIKMFLEGPTRDGVPRSERILTVLVEGNPSDSFPPPLSPRDALAADLRPRKDTFDDAILRIIAPLLGQRFAALKRRYEQRRRAEAALRKRRRRRLYYAAMFGVSVIVSLFFAWRAEQAERGLADERAGSERKVKELFQEVNAFGSAERSTAQELDGAVPLPKELLHRPGGLVSAWWYETERLGPDERGDARRIANLFDKVRALREQRKKLTARGAILDPELPALVLAEANAKLRSALNPADYDEALALYRLAQETRPDLYEPLIGLGLCAARIGDYESSSRYLKQASDLVANQHGKDSRQFGEVSLMYSRAIQNLSNKQTDYLVKFKDALTVLENQLAEMSISVARKHLELDDFKRASELLAPVVAGMMRRRERSARAAFAYNQFGVCKEAEGDYAAARLYYQLSLDSMRKVLSWDTVEVGEVLNNLAFLFMKEKKFDEAKHLLEQVRQIDKRWTPPGSPARALTDFNYSLVTYAAGERQEGLDLGLDALRRAETALGRSHPRIKAMSDELQAHLHDYAMKQMVARHFDEAEKYLRIAFRMQEDGRGVWKGGVADTIFAIGSLAEETGRFEDAERYYLEAYSRSAAGGPHPRTAAASLACLGRVYLKLGEFRDAELAIMGALDRIGKEDANRVQIEDVLCTVRTRLRTTGQAPAGEKDWKGRLAGTIESRRRVLPFR